MTTPDGPADAAAAPADPVPDTVLRVVRGEPDAEELAAVLAVLSATAESRDETPQEQSPPQTWAAYWRGVRQPLHRGPDGWRASARPR